MFWTSINFKFFIFYWISFRFLHMRDLHWAKGVYFQKVNVLILIILNRLFIMPFLFFLYKLLLTPVRKWILNVCWLPPTNLGWLNWSQGNRLGILCCIAWKWVLCWVCNWSRKQILLTFFFFWHSFAFPFLFHHLYWYKKLVMTCSSSTPSIIPHLCWS